MCLLTKATATIDDTKSYQSLIATIEKWGRSCLEEHRACQQGGPFKMPTRLIDVGVSPADVMRLVETSKMQTDPYTALSYCWGPGGNNLRTTYANYTRMLREIKDESLPRTIRDAVKVTRSLAVRYLWVDALCIIQPESKGDAYSDWATEAGKMSDYYHNAIYTISASGARDCSDGFLKPRPALVDPPTDGVAISYRDTAGVLRDMYIHPPKPMRSVCVDNSPLLKRGWCMQERAFSSRCLFFARDILIWECAERRASELDPDGDLDDQTSEQWHVWATPKGNDNLMKQGTLLSLPKEELLADAWFGMLTQYTRAEFTFLTDKLVAISSLARKIGDVTGGHYVSGCWRETIGRCLAWWAHDSPAGSRKFCKDSVAPSWSWAAVPCGVVYVSSRDRWTEYFTLEGNAEPYSGEKLRLRGSFWHQSLEELGLLERKGYEYASPRPTLKRLHWDELPESYDGLTARTFFPIARSELGTYFLLLERTGKKDGEVEEYKRLGFLEIFGSENPPASSACVLDLV